MTIQKRCEELPKNCLLLIQANTHRMAKVTRTVDFGQNSLEAMMGKSSGSEG